MCVELHRIDENGPDSIKMDILDTPENRAWAETLAIPRCATWRAEHPEHISCFGAHDTCETAPAPYCCSAYCARCAILRHLDGEPPLTPNEWIHGNG
jgi:hypothetical protein